MIRRSPCELYIKSLLVHPDNYSLEALRAIVVGQDLDYPSDDYVESLRDQMRKPRPFYPENKLHLSSVRFLRKERIIGFYHPDKISKKAHALLQDAHSKELIETMSLVGDSPEFIAHRVRLLGSPCDPTVLQQYYGFYWNLRLVDSTEINALLRMRPMRVLDADDAVGPTRDQVLQSDAIRRAAYQDPRRMAAQRPHSPMASLMNQLRMGLMPSQVELARLLSATRLGAIARADEAIHNGSRQDAAAARDYVFTAKLITEMIADIGSPDMELQRDLQQLMLETESERLPNMAQLREKKEPMVIDMPNMLMEAELDDSR